MFWRGIRGYLPANIVQGLAGFGAVALFTRLLTPEEFGRYALALTLLMLLHTALFTWLEAAMARFWAREQARGGLAGHFATVYGVFARAAAVYLPLAGLALWLAPVDAQARAALAAALFGVPVMTLFRLVQERRRAAGEVSAGASADVVQAIGGFALGAGLALGGLGGAAPILGTVLAAAACLPLALPRELASGRGGRFEAERAKAYAVYGLPVAASLILTLALTGADRFLIAAFLGEGAAGAYHAGYGLASRTLDVMFVWLGAAGAPALVAALERGGRPALEAAAREQARFMLLIMVPAAAGLILVARPLAEVMVGEAMRADAALVTPIVALGALLAGLTTYYLHQAFTLARRTGLLLAVMAAAAGVNIALNLILIPRFGLIGAAWAATAGYAAGAALSFALGRRALPLPVPWSALGRCAAACALMAAAVSLVPAVGGATELFAKAAVGAIVYALAAFALDAAGCRGLARRLFKTLEPRAAA